MSTGLDNFGAKTYTVTVRKFPFAYTIEKLKESRGFTSEQARDNKINHVSKRVLGTIKQFDGSTVGFLQDVMEGGRAPSYHAMAQALRALQESGLIECVDTEGGFIYKLTERR